MTPLDPHDPLLISKRSRGLLSRGELPLSTVDDIPPYRYSKNYIQVCYRRLVGSLLLGDVASECLLHTCVEDDLQAFTILCRYYHIPVESLLAIRALLSGERKFSTHALSPTDRKRLSELSQLRFDPEDYLPLINRKIQLHGQPLVDNR